MKIFFYPRLYYYQLWFYTPTPLYRPVILLYQNLHSASVRSHKVGESIALFGENYSIDTSPTLGGIYTLSSEKVIHSFTYEPDSIKVINNQKVYFWKKHDFMPETDFEITIND